MAQVFNKNTDKSLRAMSYEIKGLLSGGISSDDSPISLRLIDRVIKDTYSKLIHDEDRAKTAIGEKLDSQRNVFFCICLEENTDFNCVCTSQKGRFMKATLPKFIQILGEPYITFFGNTDMDIEFGRRAGISDLNSTYKLIRKPSYFVIGNIAYVALPAGFELIDWVGVSGIPVDPMVTSSKDICFDIWSQEWNISEHMRDTVKKEVISFFGNLITNTIPNADERNNSEGGNTFTTIQKP